MDNKGNLMIEAGIVLIILLLISGIFLASFENATDKIVKTQENMETLLAETVDNLINNPGDRENGTFGLAIVNEEGEAIPNSVSYSKFEALGKNYRKLVDEKIFNSKIESSMELIAQKSSV